MTERKPQEPKNREVATHQRDPQGLALCATTRRYGALLSNGLPTCRRCIILVAKAVGVIPKDWSASHG